VKPASDEGGGVRVVIADDSVLIRAGVVRVLEIAGHEVVAETGDGAALLAAVAEHRPDAVVVDVRMPPTFKDEGITAAVEIRERWPRTAVLVLSQFVEERYAADLLARDTSRIGYLLKDRVADIDSFIEALERVAAGGTALDPEVVAQLLVRRPADPLDRLTPRERDVLALMAEGRANTAIGGLLRISESAVGKHINNIFMKLDLQPDDLGHRRVLAVLRYLSA
jgi:DNA-binding NarL/FixJ family response regulator